MAPWLDGDGYPPPESRKAGRNRQWRHFRLKAVIAMPDKWEYPWFAAWDLALQAAGLALLDPQLAKQQVDLLLDADALHPSVQIPAYEWDLGDANPPLHAAAALKVYRAERVQCGREDRSDLSAAPPERTHSSTSSCLNIKMAAPGPRPTAAPRAASTCQRTDGHLAAFLAKLKQ